MSENWSFQPVFAPYHSTYQKARVGLAVLCRCKDSCVQCLLQRRGPSSSAPNKWSFPGGRLEQPGDLDEDGAVGTRRELMEVCGGGVPPGLPDLIHIECCKSGKSKQTLYHVYVIDTDASPKWDSWAPAAQSIKNAATIDASVKHITICDHQFPSVNGYCWVDMNLLIQECVDLSTDQINSSDLQHGLVRWVQMYGDHIFRTLMARSPKLSGHTSHRYPNGSSGGRSGANSGGRPRRLALRVSPSGMLQPPFASGQLSRPHLQVTPPLPYFLPGPDHHLSTNHQGVVVGTPPSPGEVFIVPPPQGVVFVQPSPSSSSATPTHFLSPGYTNLMGTGSEGSCMQIALPSQEALLPGPQDVLSPVQVHAEPRLGMEHHQAILVGAPSPVPTIPMRRDMVCRHFLAGQCSYAERCWYGHPEVVPLPPLMPVQGSSVARDGSALSIPSSPLHAPMSPYGALQNAPPPSCSTSQTSPTLSYNFPQAHVNMDSALHWGAIEGVWSHTVPGVYQGRPSLFPGGLSPGQPLLFIRPPLPSPHHLSGPPSFFPAPLVPPPDTTLTFTLLSEVVVRDPQSDLINKISHLAACGDRLYLSGGHTVQAYKVLLGGSSRYHQEGPMSVQESCTLQEIVSCLHCSKFMPALLAIGTQSGGVHTWDLRRERGPHLLTTLQQPEEPSYAVTALIHFMTSINMGQVLAAGGAGGGLTWYICQPPQKTFSVLYTDSQHSPAPVVSLQVLGGLLLSGGKDGRIFLWTMNAHRPQLDTVLSVQCSVLKDIHILPGNGFMTVGITATEVPATMALSPPALTERALVPEGPNTNGHQLNAAILNPSIDGYQVDSNLADKMSELKVHVSDDGQGEGLVKEGKWCASLWENERPPRCIKRQPIGSVVSSTFYHQPNVGNMFLSVGKPDGKVKMYNIPSFNVACELSFSGLSGKDCVWLALNASHEQPPVPMRNPFRDVLLTTVWSDGKVMVCQTQKQ